MSERQFDPEEQEIISILRTQPQPPLQAWRNGTAVASGSPAPTGWLRGGRFATLAAGLAATASVAVLATALVRSPQNPAKPAVRPSSPVPVVSALPSPRSTATPAAAATPSAVSTPVATSRPTAAPTPPPATPVATPPRWGFEDGTTQGWALGWGAGLSISNSTARAYSGSHSLALNVSPGTSSNCSSPGAGANYCSPSLLQKTNLSGIGNGTTTSYEIWAPASAQQAQIQVRATYEDAGYTVHFSQHIFLQQGWNLLTYTLPANAGGVKAIGFEIDYGNTPNPNWSGTLYVDEIKTS